MIENLMNNNFKILVTFRNAEKYIGKSLDSTLSQTYQNFKILLVNDASLDNSHEICQRYADKYPEKIIYKRNQDRLNATFNQQREIFEHCESEDIVVNLDGDDWFVDQYVLDYINEFYKREKCLYMYGQSIRLESGLKGIARPYESELHFKNMRIIPQHVSHIRTFKAKLFFEIKNQDPELSCMKDDNGNWYEMSSDSAQMYPLMEIAGYKKVKYNDKILYVYNDSNPDCDFKVDLEKQETIYRHCRAKNPFKYKDFDNEN